MLVQKSRKIIFFNYPLSIYHSTRLSELITNMYDIDMFWLNLNEISGLKGSKNRRKITFFDYSLSIYHSIRLCELITNICGFDIFGLVLNEILGLKGSQNRKIKYIHHSIRLDVLIELMYGFDILDLDLMFNLYYSINKRNNVAKSLFN